MADVIVELNRALSRNRSTDGKTAQRALGATLGFTLAGITLLLPLLEIPPAARRDLVCLALGLWLIGWLVAPSFTGGPELTGQFFRLHPVRRSILTRGLLVAACTGLPAVVALAAFAAVIVAAIPLGPGAVLISIPATLLSVLVLIVAARLTAIWFAAVSRSRVGAVVSSIVTAAIIVLAQHSWILLIAIMIHIDTGLTGGLGTAVAVLPSSWALIAVDAAGGNEWGLALTALGALAALAALLSFWWTRVVTAAPLRASVVRAPRRDGAPPISALQKELLGWRRDSLRLQDLVLPVAYAIGTTALPLVIGFGGLLPFTGVALVLLGAATSSNLYGASGTSLWTLLLAPGALAKDVRARQLAWLIVFGGLGAVFTVVGCLLYPDPGLVPWAICAFLAVLGAGAGLVVFLSVYALTPVADPHTTKHSPAGHSDLTGPAFVAIAAVLTLAAPTVGLLVAASLSHAAGLRWGSIAAAGATAALVPWALGTAAIRRLSLRGPELMHKMRSGPPDSAAASGTGQSPVHSDATTTASNATPRVSGFESMRPLENALFWTLFITAILAAVPQGLVAALHLLANSRVTGWFVALHLPERLQLPGAVGFAVLGLLLAAGAARIFVRARTRAGEH
ncbi:hypothetical protein [Microbacterium sp.]|uniref:hypothetical protein n=1 Tax=Microbacterium sp. TaxID=51671 RepID=UPI002811CFB1|nr:hypothetical protein [Microbacterium sp.]